MPVVEILGSVEGVGEDEVEILGTNDKTTAVKGFQGQTDVGDNSVVLAKQPTAGPNPARSVKT